MSRTLSLAMREAMNSQETGEVAVVLLTLEHPSFPEPLLLSSDPTERLSEEPLSYGTISRGDTYVFCPMGVTLPDDLGERAPVARIVVENISRELIKVMKPLAGLATGKVEIVLASSPDEVEIEYPVLDIVRAPYNANTITLEFSIDALTEEPYPAGAFDPSGFPGLH